MTWKHSRSDLRAKKPNISAAGINRDIPLETILDPCLTFCGQPLKIDRSPPFVSLVTFLPWLLVPRLGAKNIMNILDLLIPPDGGMHPFPAQRFQRIIYVRQGDPPASKEVGEQRLVREFIILHRGRICHAVEYGFIQAS